MCDGCSACCTVFACTAIGKPMGVPCVHAFAGHGCAIYDLRSQGCRDFRCLWLAGSLPEEARPDRIGVIFVLGKTDSPLTLALGSQPVEARECAPDGFNRPLSLGIINLLSDKMLVNLIRGEAREMLMPAWMKPKVIALLEVGDGN
jgi:hypothetical protein